MNLFTGIGSLALITDTQQFTYREVDERVEGMRLHLQELGVEKGDRIAFIATLKWQTALLFFALFRLGAIAAPLSTRLPPRKIQESLAALGTDHLLDPETLSYSSSSTPPVALEENALATLLFTSGTTSSPKIASHTLGNHIYSALGSNAALDLRPEARWLLSLPLFHVGGIAILFRSFLKGSTVVISERPLTEAIATQRISHLSLVPTQLQRLIREPTLLAQLSCILLGGAPIPPALYAHAKQINPNLFSTYGLTEMSSQVTLDGHPPLAFRELSLAPDGEILVRGETLFQGYLTHGGKISLPLTDDGWFATGDLGKRTDKGDLEIIGRKDNLFISGGENIQPEEIETLLCSLTGISQAVVVPIPDPEFGARPVAFFVDETGSYTPDSLNRFLQNHLPHFKLPLRYLPLPEPFKTGKPSRHELKKLAAHYLSLANK
jgi:o-succinylbenzoate---CoA ligase